MRRRQPFRAGRVWLLAWTLAFGALGFVPGFAGLTYPLGLVSAVVVGCVGPGVAARHVALSFGARPALSRDDLFLEGLWAALRLQLLVVGTALVHGIRVGFCQPGEDALRWALGPALGAIVAGAWGAVVGVTCASTPRWRWLLAVGLPLLSYGVSFARFYTSPMVFAFDHFVGFFAGTLYDTELGSLERLWTYRLGSAGFVACGVWWVNAFRRVEGKIRFSSPRSRTTAGILAAATACIVTARGPDLGHYQTVSSLQRVLSREAREGRCVVQFGRGVSGDGAALVARECTAHVAELEQYFDVQGPAEIRVYLFASADQKAWLMGARHVYVAKPWRNEIYVQVAGFPHPVLRHELAHVVAGALGRGPFAVAGSVAGIVPDPGRIEGFAVAAAPDESDPLTALQWAAAMKQLGILPPLRDLFQLGFFGVNSSTAYTVAGAFVGWLRDVHGVATLQRWYGGEPLDGAAGRPLSALERDFHALLDGIGLTQTELAAARSRFDRPPVLARKCPHQVDDSLTEGLGLVAGGECRDARRVLGDVLRMDPSAVRAEFGLGQCAHSDGDVESAKARFHTLATSPDAPSLIRAAAWERLADVEWQAGETVPAEEHYETARSLVLDEDRLRQLDVKLLGLRSQDELEQRGVAAVFFGSGGKGPLPVHTGVRLGRWAQETQAPLALYLIGKQLWAAAEWLEAKELLFRAATSDALPGRMRREAWRGVLITGCAIRDGAAVEGAEAALQQDTEAPRALQEAARALARRCLGPRGSQ